MEQADFAVAPYHVYVPSFGEWGFALAGSSAPRVASELPPDLRFLTPATLREMFDFPRDMARVPVEVNRLHTQALVRYYEHEWALISR
jgi:spermidine synthase